MTTTPPVPDPTPGPAHLQAFRDRLASLPDPSPHAPYRILLSGCLAGWTCGVDGSDNGFGASPWSSFYQFLRSDPRILLLSFCPEQHAMGTPRRTPDLHGGDGAAVLAGRATARFEDGEDCTDAMIAGAKAMVAFAQHERADFALLVDASGACGSQVISLGSRFVPVRQHQRGMGVAAAALHAAGFPLCSQRDHLTLALLRHRFDPTFPVDPALRDHHDHPWTRSYFAQ
jgi:uncharacterized protein YbbK (DUF523 family)